MMRGPSMWVEAPFNFSATARRAKARKLVRQHGQKVAVLAPRARCFCFASCYLLASALIRLSMPRFKKQHFGRGDREGVPREEEVIREAMLQIFWFRPDTLVFNNPLAGRGLPHGPRVQRRCSLHNPGGEPRV